MDITDEPGDREAGVHTIPVVAGAFLISRCAHAFLGTHQKWPLRNVLIALLEFVPQSIAYGKGDFASGHAILCAPLQGLEWH